jgi:hypothetical protein
LLQSRDLETEFFPPNFLLLRLWKIAFCLKSDLSLAVANANLDHPETGRGFITLASEENKEKGC